MRIYIINITHTYFHLYRVASRAGGLVHYQYGVFMSGMIILVKVCISNFMYCTGIWRLTGALVVSLMFFSCWFHYFSILGKMFPMVPPPSPP